MEYWRPGVKEFGSRQEGGVLEACCGVQEFRR